MAPRAAPVGEHLVLASSGRAPHPGSEPRQARSAEGLRERKKRSRREAIQREAMRLFQQQGYEATTIERIAEAVEISPSTFFNYFPTKEDVVFHDPYDPLFVSGLLARPSDEPLGVAIRHVLRGLARVFERDRAIILARSRLVLEVPALRARAWEELERARDLLCAVTASRTGRDRDDFELRVTTMVLMGAMHTAHLEWVRHGGGGDPGELFERALDVVEAGARLDAIGAGPAGRHGGAAPW